MAQPSQVLCEEGGSIDIGEKLNMKQEDRDIPDTPETSTPSSGSSKRPTNESSQENLRKLTFDRGGGKVSATIGELQEASKTVCVMGSGRFGTHNVKLIKSVKSKKISCLEPGGNIGWKYVDVTCLVCPSKTSEFSESGLAKNQSGGGR